MQTTLERKGVVKASRFNGCMRYYAKSMGLMVFAAIVVLAVSGVLGFAIMRYTDVCRAEGPMPNFAVTSVIAFVCAVWATKHGARFLTRFGTPRTSVWLSTVLSTILWMLLLLVLTLALNTLLSGVVLLLSGSNPDAYRVVSYDNAELTSAQVFSASLNESLAGLPERALWLAEWCCVFCLIGACLRRNKWLTLGIMVGVPMVLAITLLIPAVRETIAMVESADQNQLMMVGLRWMAWFGRAAQWIEDNWQLVQGGLALASLPLSWIVMRETAQP